MRMGFGTRNLVGNQRDQLILDNKTVFSQQVFKPYTTCQAVEVRYSLIFQPTNGVVEQLVKFVFMFTIPVGYIKTYPGKVLNFGFYAQNRFQLIR